MSNNEHLTMDERAAKGEFVKVAVYLTPAAHGLLVAMAAADDHGDVEECIRQKMAKEVSSWMESIGCTQAAESLFLSGGLTGKGVA